MYGSDGTRRQLFQPRRVFVCTECHKSFRNTVDLYQHVEMCLLEAFENEALSIFSEPSVTAKSSSQTSAAPFGIVAKPSGLPPMEGRVEVRLGVGLPEKDQTGMYHTPAGTSKQYAEHEDEGDAAGPSSSRMIEGPGGLRLVVTVEKDDGRREEDVQKDDGMNMTDMMGDYMDDDMTIQEEEEEEMNTSLATYSRRRVIGALANSDDEPYKPKMECPTCGLVLYRHNFATHYRIHTGELPFPCEYCVKRFRSTSALKVHTRAHTGEKPYACPSCDYAALTKRNLDRHILNNHVREGERRGPRSRRSKYRDETPDEMGVWPQSLNKNMNRCVYAADKDHQYERNDAMDEMDDEVMMGNYEDDEEEMEGQMEDSVEQDE